jgi:hypothetical protein
MTMSNQMDKWHEDEKALAVERRLMNEALAQLGQAELKYSARRSAARLIFGLDLTGSREPSLRQARIATAAMFDTIKAFSAVAVKLIYYRGTDECRESRWYDDPEILSQSMRKLSCERGGTQIGRCSLGIIARTIPTSSSNWRKRSGGDPRRSSCSMNAPITMNGL